VKPACPKCGHDDSRVVESRAYSSRGEIRRRRICTRCDGRFTTYETVREDVVFEDPALLRLLPKLLSAIDEYIAAKNIDTTGGVK
jgi:hypothetical protein